MDMEGHVMTRLALMILTVLCSYQTLYLYKYNAKANECLDNNGVYAMTYDGYKCLKHDEHGAIKK